VTADPTASSRVTLTALTAPRAAREDLADDVRCGLTGPVKSLPPKHLYDARGSELFERITELPEYPVTRAETAVLEQAATELIAGSRPAELLELGSGSSRKTRLLLEAMHAAGTGDRYVPLDVSPAAIEGAAVELVGAYPWLTVHGYVGDFHTDLGRVPRDGRRLVAFLGSTIGNLGRAERHILFEAVAAVLEADDRFLLGAHLVAPAEVLEPAYDDAAGVTAEFTRNLLVVLNRELDGDLPLDAFRHVAEWDPTEERVTLSLEATREVRAHLASLDLDVNFSMGERVIVEHSHKFRVPDLTGELAAAGLTVLQIHDGDDSGFVSLLAGRST
jgi:L-histidine Nalpha-methyltransferase